MTPDEITVFYEEAFRTLDMGRHETPEITIEFYPYIGINHTIRIRDDRILVRIAELCREMPANEQKALACILVSKLLRKPVPPSARQVYSRFVKSHSLQEAARDSKRARGRKVLTGTKGEFFDLDGVFEKINQIYFGNRIEKPELSWSARKTFRILGHHDPAHKAIIISRTLDAPDVPKFVVEYVMFHEMLHVALPTEHVNGRRLNHTPKFRQEERKFLYYNEAESWIADNARKLKRRAGGK